MRAKEIRSTSTDTDPDPLELDSPITLSLSLASSSSSSSWAWLSCLSRAYMYWRQPPSSPTKGQTHRDREAKADGARVFGLISVKRTRFLRRGLVLESLVGGPTVFSVRSAAPPYVALPALQLASGKNARTFESPILGSFLPFSFWSFSADVFSSRTGILSLLIISLRRDKT